MNQGVNFPFFYSSQSVTWQNKKKFGTIWKLKSVIRKEAYKQT